MLLYLFTPPPPPKKKKKNSQHPLPTKLKRETSDANKLAQGFSEKDMNQNVYICSKPAACQDDNCPHSAVLSPGKIPSDIR